MLFSLTFRNLVGTIN